MIARPIPGPIIEMVKREIEIQGFLGEGHLNIVNAYEVLEPTTSSSSPVTHTHTFTLTLTFRWP